MRETSPYHIVITFLNHRLIRVSYPTSPSSNGIVFRSKKVSRSIICQVLPWPCCRTGSSCMLAKLSTSTFDLSQSLSSKKSQQSTRTIHFCHRCFSRLCPNFPNSTRAVTSLSLGSRQESGGPVGN